MGGGLLASRQTGKQQAWLTRQSQTDPGPSRSQIGRRNATGGGGDVDETRTGSRSDKCKTFARLIQITYDSQPKSREAQPFRTMRCDTVRSDVATLLPVRVTGRGPPAVLARVREPLTVNGTVCSDPRSWIRVTPSFCLPLGILY